MKTTSLLSIAVLSATLLVGSTVSSRAQGMPPESRKNIHLLFDQHDKIERTVALTKTGYTATTTSTNPAVVRALQAHVKQMSKRLEDGLMVRRWDPAFAEYVDAYSDLEHTFTKIPDGIQATVTGKTQDAILIAQNHAQVIADFAAHGWAAHDRSHPAVLGATEEETTSVPGKAQCQNCRAQADPKKPAAAGGCMCGGSGKGPGRGKAN